MALPLQPSLQPLPYWYKRSLLLLILIMAVFILGLLQPARHSNATVLDNEQRGYLKTVSEAVRQARTRIWCMLYVISPGQQADHPVSYLLQLLAEAQARGVDVRVVVDRSAADAAWPGPDNSPAVNWMRDHGITVYEDEISRTTHGKVLLIDDQAIVGSHNWTAWALTRNREISLLSRDNKTLLQIEHTFTSAFKNAVH